MNYRQVIFKHTALKLCVIILADKLNGVRDRKTLIKIIHLNLNKQIEWL